MVKKLDTYVLKSIELESKKLNNKGLIKNPLQYFSSSYESEIFITKLKHNSHCINFFHATS